MRMVLVLGVVGGIVASALVSGEAHAQQFSTVCQFLGGPKSGEIQDYASRPPVPVGTPCNDGVQSWGVVIPRSPLPPHTPGAIPLRSPVSGLWGVVQAPPCPNGGNHCSVPSNMNAVDLVALDPSGSPVPCAGRTVMAPAAGLVVQAVNDQLDMMNVHGAHPAGNHVVIQIAPNAFAILAHLAAGSVQVQPGTQVSAGQPVGMCGNSGRGSGPHLHFHVQSQPDPLNFQSSGIPMVFPQINLWSGGGCRPHENRALRMQDILC